MEALLCGERVSSGSFGTSRQGNSQLSLLPHRAIQKWHDERENNELKRLDKLGNTSHHHHRRVADVVGGPQTRKRQ